MIEAWLDWLAAAALGRPRRVVGLWALLILAALAGAVRLPDVLHTGPGAIEGGQSERVERLLRQEFHFPYLFSLAVLPLDAGQDKAWRRLLPGLIHYLGGRPDLALASVQPLEAVPLPLPRGAPALLLGLNADSFEQAERQVPRVRAALATWQHTTPGAGGLALAVTGDTAFSYDMNALSAEQGLQAERRVLALALLILLLVFRSPLAALLPLLVGAGGIGLTLGYLYLLGHYYPLSVLIRNVVSMIGLGLGIDYALIMVSRFREEAAARPLPEALQATLRTAGHAVIVSGLAVIAGLLGLLAIPLTITRSIGLGGVLVVTVVLTLSLTLLPALLVLLAPVLDWPGGPAPRPQASDRWRRWSLWVTHRPWTALALSGACLAGLGLQARQLRLEPPHLAEMPAAMEARAAADRLLGSGDATLSPVYLVLESPDGSALLPGRQAISAWLDDLQRRRPAARFFIAPWLPPISLPGIGPPPGWNEDGSKMLVLAYPPDEAAAEALVRELWVARPPAGVRLIVGGLAALNEELRQVLAASFPWVLAWVGLATLVILLASFRSLLLPLKALAMNALTVAAAFGCLVLVFQQGWGCRWLGLPQPPGSVLLTVPALLFCIVFGLSMDYEVFLLSRIREAYIASGDNRQAVAEGLAQTGGLISGAALIMVVVFGAFTLADIILVKETGFGLGMAVLIDATLVRLVMVPALMELAGKWNWWMPKIRK